MPTKPATKQTPSRRDTVATAAPPGLMPGGRALHLPLPQDSQLASLETGLNSFHLADSPRGCLVTIRNLCALDREAVIVAAGSHFWFYDLQGDDKVLDGDYMAGPVHIEVPPGATVPFRFSDQRRPVYKVGVAVRVMFGNPDGFPPARYDDFFWEMVLPPLPLISPRPLYPAVGEIHLDFRLKRSQAIPHRGKPLPLPGKQPPSNALSDEQTQMPPGGPHYPQLPASHLSWPPIPGPLTRPHVSWFELAERPQ